MSASRISFEPFLCNLDVKFINIYCFHEYLHKYRHIGLRSMILTCPAMAIHGAKLSIEHRFDHKMLC